MHGFCVDAGPVRMIAGKFTNKLWNTGVTFYRTIN